jgi:hypothetical protein
MLGRLLQLAGMVILPIGLWIGLVRGNVRMEVKLLAIGGCVYLIGYLLSRKQPDA